MTLAFSPDQLLGASAVDPPLQRTQFIQRGLMRGLQLPVRSGRLVQHAAELGGPLECGQQEPLAFGEIIRKSLVVIHNDNRSNDSCRLKKTISGILWDDATIPAPSATAA